MINIETGNYPYKVTDSGCDIKAGIRDLLEDTLTYTNLKPFEQNELFNVLSSHLELSESLFAFEEQARLLGLSFADLHYHNKHHAVYQIGYDSLSIIRDLLIRNDYLSDHLTNEAVVASFIGAINHDSGYFTAKDFSDNFAARVPVHVEESKLQLKRALTEIPLPSFLSRDRVEELALVGIHNTYFPFNELRAKQLQNLLGGMNKSDRLEARIVGLSTQLADLGGQVARVDYKYNLLKDLREEMNCVTPGNGDAMIGLDHELDAKSCGFINFVVKKEVGKTASAFLGKNNSFQRAWER